MSRTSLSFLVSLSALLLSACAPDRAAAPGGAALATALAAVEAPSTRDVPPYSAFAAPEWGALFDRTSGWTGADGVYSIPLSGDERPGSGATGTTLWTFSDTFIGNVNPNDTRAAGTTLVNNTMALLTGDQPDPAQISFMWGTASNGAPAARVIPNTDVKHWFWPVDGIVVGGQIVFYTLRMKSNGQGGSFGFDVDGISLIADAASNPTPFSTYRQVVAPLFVPPTSTRGEVTFGHAILANTAAAGAPNPDGWLYIYGLQNDINKKLLVARVRPANIGQFSRYRFWNGSAWVPDIANAAPLTNRMSSEFSVTPLSDGRFLLVFQLDALSETIAVRYGTSPTGPWGPPIPIWDCPEARMTSNTWVYGAKAHPHLSRPGELLISYHVNTFDFIEHFQYADIYRPRFIRLPIGP